MSSTVIMSKNRLEAFSDGVLAIIITIMVLELKVPHGEDLSTLIPLWPIFLSYTLSFLYIAIYWNNHHHLLHTLQKVNGSILWSNLHLLFWLSLVPFTTGWMGENHFSSHSVFLYGVSLLMSAVSYFILQNCIISSQGPDSLLKKAIGNDKKGNLSLFLYIGAILISLYSSVTAVALYFIVAFIWIIPDKRIEKLSQ